uniref:Secreted protein n=1 Tax=Ascaris lumbricoides TaxID=6252 RepID=A0A0M3IJK5_ASCLU
MLILVFFSSCHFLATNFLPLSGTSREKIDFHKNNDVKNFSELLDSFDGGFFFVECNKLILLIFATTSQQQCCLLTFKSFTLRSIVIFFLKRAVRNRVKLPTDPTYSFPFSEINWAS